MAKTKPLPPSYRGSSKYRDMVLSSARIYYQNHRSERLAYRKAYTEKNKDQIVEKRRLDYSARPAYFKKRNSDYYLKNKERLNKNGKIWRLSNLEKEKIANKRWRDAHPDVLNARWMKQQANKMRAVPKWANSFFMREAYHLSRLRTKATGFKWHVDHIVPLRSKIVCGLHVENNLQVIPANHNRAKSNYYWPDMP